MRKRVFGSIFLTSLVTLLLTTGLLLLAVHAGLTNDMRRRLVTESSYLSAVDNIREKLEKFGSVYADRLTLVAQDGTVLYDNRTNASEMRRQRRKARARTTVCPKPSLSRRFITRCA